MENHYEKNMEISIRSVLYAASFVCGILWFQRRFFYAYVTMKYDGGVFKVYMDGRKEYTTGVDDYQKEEIFLAVQDAVKETVGQACDYGEYYCLAESGGLVQWEKTTAEDGSMGAA